MTFLKNSNRSIGDGAFAYCNNLDSMYISDLTAYLNIAFDGLNTNPMKYADKLYINNKRIAGTLQIPENITKIPGYAFDGCDGITSVIIPDSVTSIGANAFSNCSGLTSVITPDSVTKIGRNAFYGCSSLKDVHITDIAKWCEIDFGNDTSNPMYYADNLYVNDVLIAELVIPNSVTSIGNYAFYNCSGLTSVEIPESVISIGQNAFHECDNLKDVHIKDIAKWCEIDFIENGYSSYPSSNPFCYADNLYVNDVLTTELIIPNSVTSIGDYTFYSCSGLTSVKIPNSVTSIGKMAFCRCSKLTDITIPSSIKNIGERTFNNCDCLTSVNYNASKVFSNIFDRYNNIMLVVLGANVKCIDTDAFTDCTKLKRIIISKSVTEIDKAAFKDCTSLTTVEYGGSKTDWNEMYIGTENENLTNANINYNSPLFATENIILTLPTVTSVEDETTRTFTVEIEQPVIGSYVYVVTYDANDMPLNISKVPLNLFEPTTVAVDKSDNDNYAKIFVWTDEMQPLTYVKPIELQ